MTEFSSYYDFVGDTESQNLHKLLSKPDVVIQDTKIRSALSQDFFLPEFILLKNKGVMKIRNCRKIITHPSIDSSSTNSIYSKVLLFSPEAEENMDMEKLKHLYNKKDETSVSDQNGDNETVIQRIERY